MTRLLDVILSVVALLFLIPLLIPVAVILRLSGEGEVFYIQERVGLSGKPFGLIKFATMLKNSPNIGTGEITVRDDPRVLPFGKFLRKTKLNELPQLWNILNGDISIVGPRPMVPKTYAQYPNSARVKLNQIRPGLTGIGSIIFRDEERYLVDLEDPMAFYREFIIPYKVQLELWYFKNKSLRLYLAIIIVTAWVIAFPTSRISETVFRDLPESPRELN